MATTSIVDKLAKLERKIEKRQATIAEETKQLNEEPETGIKKTVTGYVPVAVLSSFTGYF